MDRIGTSLHFYYAGMVILFALILGGGTEQGPWLPALFMGLGGIIDTRLARMARALAIAILCLVLLQFVPVARTLPALPSTGGIYFAFYSPAPQNSLESSLFVLSVLGFFLFLSRFSDADQERLTSFLMVGLFVNLVAATIEFSYGGSANSAGAFPYAFQAGLFANENHFSSLVYVMIPLLAYLTLHRRRQLAAFAGFLGVMLLVLFAAGSRAGMAIATTLAIVSALWFYPREQSNARKIGVLAIGIATIVLIGWRFGFDSAIENDLRTVFYQTTWRAIKDHWLAGTGLGTFTLIYPGVERTNQIISVFANHAHNEYLELWLEAGLPAVVLIGIFVVLVLLSFSRSGLAEATFIAIIALMLHSSVDYPLRTFGLAIPLAFFSAVILSVKPHPDDEATASMNARLQEERRRSRRRQRRSEVRGDVR
jgi:O-antigen ligase